MLVIALVWSIGDIRAQDDCIGNCKGVWVPWRGLWLQVVVA